MSGYSSNLIGWHLNLPGIGRLENVHASTTARGECDSVSVVSLESPMPLASSGRLSATGAPSVVVDSVQTLLCRHAG